MRLTDAERAERALWLCEALKGKADHDDLTKEIVKERRLQSKALEKRIDQLRREVETGETDDTQLELPGGEG